MQFKHLKVKSRFDEILFSMLINNGSKSALNVELFQIYFIFFPLWHSELKNEI